MKILSNKNGYTILEIMMAVTIALIIGSSITFSLRPFLLEKRVEKEVVSLWKELSALKSKVLKSDTTYIVKFNTGDNSYQIYKDADNDMVADAGEEITSPFPAKIIFSLPSPTPSSRPDNVTGTPSNSVEDDWAAQLEILNDDMASINSGRIFLSSPIIEKIGYCIQVKDNTQTVKLFKWTGSQWNEM